MTGLSEKLVPFGGNDRRWTLERFDDLDQHYSALRRARPSLGWISNQLSPGKVHGSVVSCRQGAVSVTCTAAGGSFEMRGPVSTGNLVLSLSIESPTPMLQWMRPAQAGMAGVFLPDRAVDVISRGNVSFAVIDIPRDELENRARQLGIGIDSRRLAQSGILPGQIAAGLRARLSTLIAAMHQGRTPRLPPGYHLDAMIVTAAVSLLGREASDGDPMQLHGYHRIVARARAYIDAHLDSPIAIDDLVAAAFASRRTLFRAFTETLGETPQSYILKLRLNRIRSDLATPREAMRTVTVVSNHWGIPELGRLASRYREQFGELPRDTLARRGMLRASQAA
jgi:AraC-like DNA-binding protein